MPDKRITRTVRMSESLADEIDAARGSVPFERWARGVFQGHLNAKPTPISVDHEMALRNRTASRRDSTDVKRDVQPVAKGKKK